MDRRQKEKLVDSLTNAFKESEASFLIGYRGLSVPQMQTLRKRLQQKNASLKVSKVRLMKRAAQAIQEGEILVPLLKEQIALVFASKEAPEVARVLRDFVKEHEALQVLAALLEKQLFDQAAVMRIASLPSRQELLSQVCRNFKAPVVGCVVVLKVMLLRLLWAVKSIESKKQSG